MMAIVLDFGLNQPAYRFRKMEHQISFYLFFEHWMAKCLDLEYDQKILIFYE